MVGQTLRLTNANYLWLLKQGKSVNQFIRELRERDEEQMKDIEQKTMIYEIENYNRSVKKRLDSTEKNIKRIIEQMKKDGYDMSNF